MLPSGDVIYLRVALVARSSVIKRDKSPEHLHFSIEAGHSETYTKGTAQTQINL